MVVTLSSPGQDSSSINSICLPNVSSPTPSSSSLALTGCGDGCMRLWNLHTKSVAKEFKGHLGYVSSVAWLPNSTHVVSASMDASLRIWDIEASKPCIGLLTGHSDVINCLTLAPPSKMAYTCSWDKTIKSWDVRIPHSCVGTMIGHEAPVTWVSSLGDWTLLSASHDLTIRAWDLRSERCIQIYENGHNKYITNICPLSNNPSASSSASASSTHFISVGYDRAVSLWDVSKDEPIQRYVLPEPQEPKLSSSASSMARSLSSLSAPNPGAIHCVLSVPSSSRSIIDQESERRSAASSSSSAAPSPLWKKSMIITGQANGTISTFSSFPSHSTYTETTSGVFCLAHNPQNGDIISGHKDGTLRVWNSHSSASDWKESSAESGNAVLQRVEDAESEDSPPKAATASSAAPSSLSGIESEFSKLLQKQEENLREVIEMAKKMHVNHTQ